MYIQGISKSINLSKLNKPIAIVLIILLLIGVFSVIGPGVQADSVPAATGKVNASSGAYLRAKPTTDSKAVTLLKDNTSLSISNEVFVKDGSSKATNRWYQVTVSGKKGYIRSDLVDSIKYKETASSTTDALNYRVGPSSAMTKKGTFKNGASVTVVLNAELKGSSTDWYKVKVGSNYYFACAEWIKVGKTSKTTNLAAVAAPVPETTPDVEEEEEPELPAKPVIESSGLTYPKTLLQGMSFGLSGVISCDRDMEKARFGILNSKGKWIIDVKRDIDEDTFYVSEVDPAVKFGTLTVGTYTYRGYVYVNGKAYRVINKKFTVKKGNGGEKLTATAIELAWPYGTSKKTYGKKPTAAYKAALAAVYPEHNKWNKRAAKGASCDVFIGTVCRYSGIDPNMPRTVNTIWKYLPKHPDKWAKVDYSYEESDLKSGDIIIYYPKKGSRHVCMYIKINGKGYCVEASYTRGLYGFINRSLGKFYKPSKMKKFAVYRAIGGGASASVAPSSDAD